MRPNRYRGMQRAWDRLLAVPTEELETHWGTVEHAEKGQGAPLLVSHGIMDISVPTLLVHAADDPLAGYDAAVDAAARIPRARPITIQKGGHTFVGAEAEVRKEVAAFIESAVHQSTPVAVP